MDGNQKEMNSDPDKVVGKGKKRVDASAKVTGRAKFAGDVGFSDMCWVSVVRSKYPHAEISNIDVSEASKSPGVLAVLTADDVPGDNVVPVIEDDQPALVNCKARYRGEPLALVIARKREVAHRGVDKVNVDYVELPAVFDLMEALRTESVRVPRKEVGERGNVFDEMIIRKGNVERGFSKSSVVVQSKYRTGRQEHAYLESQCVTAVPEGRGGMAIYGSMQCPYYVQSAVSRVLGLSLNKVRVIQQVTGGGFGGKEDIPSHIGALAGLAAYRVRKPVRLVYDRREDISFTSKRHPSLVRYKSGASSDGQLLAIEAEVYLDAGAYQTLSPAVLWRSLVHTAGPYRIPNVSVTARTIATNTVPNGAFRGFGSPQVIFAHESQMDKLAQKLRMDPLDIRKINGLREGDRTSTGQELDSSIGLLETVERAERISDWQAQKARIAKWNSNHRRVKKGMGVSTVMYGVGMGAKAPFLEKAGAYVKLELDGSLTVAVGNTEMGQGSETVLTQIAAAGMGIDVDMVNIVPVDTSRVPDSGPTVASRTTTMAGNAILDAIETIKERVCKFGAELLSASSVEIREGKVHSSDGRTDPAPLVSVAEAMWTKNENLGAEGWAKGPSVDWNPSCGQGKAYFVYSYATHICKVEIDLWTGSTSVDDYVAVHDSGTIVNPTTAEGQVEGGIAQGIGYALTEKLSEENGRFSDPDLTDYRIPTTRDVPHCIKIDFVQKPYSGGPFGAKGLGEVPLMASHAAVINAVKKAIGCDINRYPASPETIFCSLFQKRQDVLDK